MQKVSRAVLLHCTIILIYTVVWEKFGVKKFLSDATYDKNLAHENFLATNK